MSILRAFLLATSSVAAAAALAAPAHAENEKTYRFDISAQPLEGALVELTEETGLQLIYSAELTRGLKSPGASGSMTAQAALQRLLAGTGLTFRMTSTGAITIERPLGNAEGEKVTAAVNVEGYQGSPYFGGAGVAAGVNGVNGSRDITATEGTGSFTSGALTIGSKVPQALKDVPQSVSVLTQERLVQQNVTDLTGAMRQLPGVTLVQGGTSLETEFYSRGFYINTFQIDGGAPFSTTVPYGASFGPNGGQTYFPMIDMAQYDHVEMVRGAAGVFNGYGKPSGVVNLVRKKPLDHPQFVIEGQLGSWNNYRTMLDVSSPLAFDGKLRGRFVTTWQDREYFYDLANDNRTTLYGILELEATPTTRVTAGISYSNIHALPWQNGLPRMITGTDLELPRSTCLCFPWNRWDVETTEYFASIEQTLGSDWTAKFDITKNIQDSVRKVGQNALGVRPDTLKGPRLSGTYTEFANDQLSAEARVSGGFELFGQRQEVTVGVSYKNTDGAGLTAYLPLIQTPYQPYSGAPTYYLGSPNGASPPIDVFNFNPFDPLYTEPRNPLPYLRFKQNDNIQYLAYINLRLTAFDRLHLTTGFNWSRFETNSSQENFCTSIPASGTPAPTNCVGKEIGDTYIDQYADSNNVGDSDVTWPPSATLSYDVTDALTVHLGYTDIYSSQSNYLDQDLQPIDPITGANIEFGVKWAPRSGKFNAALAVYRIRQKGFAAENGYWDVNVTEEDMANNIWQYFVAPNGLRVPNGNIDIDHTCCWTSDPNKTAESLGFDLDVGGEILPGWQVAASYTYNRTKQIGSSYGEQNRLPFLTIAPQHLYKVWMTYDFGASGKAGWLSGLSLSLGANGQSHGFYSGDVCPEPGPETPFGSSCLTDYEEYQFTVPAHVVFSGRIDYSFSETWSLAVNVENILDKTYYQTVGMFPTGGNWYGAPRSFTATLRAKW